MMPSDGADHRDQKPGAKADGERHAGAIEQAGEDVVAEARRAEPVLGRRRLVRPADALGRAVFGEQRREDRDEDDDGEDGHPDEGLAVVEQLG